MTLLFALAGGLTLSGIAANCYRIVARKPVSRAENLVSIADAALLRAKAEGRDRIVVAAVRERETSDAR
jgi:GGDEF domain-containing protein